MGTIRAVFFDFGGTLFSYHSLGGSSVQMIERVARGAGYLGSDVGELARAYARSSGAAFAAYAPQPFYLHRDVFHDLFRRFAAELDLTVTPEYLELAYTEMHDWMVGSFSLRDECLRVLGALRERGLYLSIVSNIDDEFLQPMVARSGLEEWMDDWSSSEEARSCKPDAGFFLHALGKSGCRAAEVLFVGDSPEHDIAGARSVGMCTALIVDAGVAPPGNRGEMDESLTRPDHTIRSLDELIAITEPD